MSDEILSVVQNWRRPANVARVIDAIRSQSVPSKLAVVECALEPKFTLPPDVLAKADYVFRVERANLGPCCRFIPSMMIPQIPLTMFWLDDFLPGPKCLEAFMRHRSRLEDLKAATIGQDGRIFYDNKLGIVRKRVSAPASGMLPVHVVVSSELCLTRNVSFATAFRDQLIHKNLGVESLSLFEDDLFLCCGISWGTNCRSEVFSPSTPDESYRAHRLPSNDALSARPDHDAKRNSMIFRICREMNAYGRPIRQ